MKPLLFVLLLALSSSFLTVEVSASEVRTWTSSDGSSSFEGELLEFSGDGVRIQRVSDRKTFQLPLDRLSEADREFVEGLIADERRNTSVADGPWADQITGEFQKGTSREGLNFQIYGNPRWKGSERYPLLIWLHGAGQSGSDNEAQMGRPTRIFSSEAHQEEYPSFILAPQCPAREIGWKDSVESDLVALIEDLVANLPIDRSRLYVLGSSMGGFGSWRIAANHPDLFAAVVPICGGGRVGDAETLKDIPIWAFHGDQDADVPVEKSREMVEGIQGAGGEKIRYSELEGKGHLIAAEVCEREDLAPWIYGQTRAESE
ncbi:MAG: prolyl oligopeptidase family serine peptidase, partial [Verrucomicrobiota bacterium]